MGIQWIAAAALMGLAAYGMAYAAISRAFGIGRRPAAERRPAGGGALASAAELIGRAAPQTETARRTMAGRIAAAGLDMTVEAYRARRLAGAAIAATCAMALSIMLSAGPVRSLAFTAIAAAAGFCYQRMRITLLARRRAERIEAQLPSALEMLSASVRAGLTIERALDLVSRRTDGVIADEFKRTVRDITAYGYTSAEALKRMDARCGVQPMSLFASAAAQALEQGSAVGPVLASQARIARTNYFQKIEERANKMPVKIVVPLVTCILPGVIAVALAPAVMTIVNTVSGF